MAETAFQIQYRQEFIAAFEQHQSLLRDSTTTEAVIKGNQATFLVAGSGGATAKTRGVNGLIPARGDDLQQPVATLVEWHDLVRKTDFNIFASQGNQRAIMQMTCMAVINRKVDSDIITELNTGTINTGAAANATLALCLEAKTRLGQADVPWDGNLTMLITPNFEGELLSIASFTSRDFTQNGPIDQTPEAWRDRQMAYKWLGMNFIVHPALPGETTVNAQCFAYHKNAIGHAYNADNIEARAGYDEEQDYSWSRCSIYMGSQLLQNSGVVVVNTIDNTLIA